MNQNMGVLHHERPRYLLQLLLPPALAMWTVEIQSGWRPCFFFPRTIDRQLGDYPVRWDISVVSILGNYRNEACLGLEPQGSLGLNAWQVHRK